MSTPGEMLSALSREARARLGAGRSPGDARVFRGRTVEELIPRIQRELGSDAIILRRREGLTGGVLGFFQQQWVEIEAVAGEPHLDVYDEQESAAPPIPPPPSAEPAEPLARPSSSRRPMPAQRPMAHPPLSRPPMRRPLMSRPPMRRLTSRRRHPPIRGRRPRRRRRLQRPSMASRRPRPRRPPPPGSCPQPPLHRHRPPNRLSMRVRAPRGKAAAAT